MYEKFDTVETLLVYGAHANDISSRGYGPIHTVLHGRYQRPGVHQCIKLLLEYGADVNMQDEQGRTPLFLIVNYMEINVELSLSYSRLLLEFHADVNIPFTRYYSNTWRDDNVLGDTPLHIAVRKQEIKMVQLLLDYHPNLSIRNQEDDTVLDIAKKMESYPIIEIIEEKRRHQIYKYLVCHWMP